MISEIIIPVMDQATETVLLTGWRKQEGRTSNLGTGVTAKFKRLRSYTFRPGNNREREGLSTRGCAIRPK